MSGMTLCGFGIALCFGATRTASTAVRGFCAAAALVLLVALPFVG